MKVLLVHCRYQIRGGEDTIFESERDMLRAAGVEVVCFEKSNADFARTCSRPAQFIRTIWNRAAYREMLDVLRRERPDVAHFHNTFPALSPAVYWACAKAGVPVVQTLHNFRTACLNGYFFRERECRICMRCLGRAPFAGVFRKCYRNSFAASATVAAMLAVHRLLGTWRRKVTRYIALSEFGRETFAAAGLPADRIVVKRNVVESVPANADTRSGTLDLDSSTQSKSVSSPVCRVVFLGRLSPEKGVDVLLRAWALFCRDANASHPTPALLVIIGDGTERAALESLAGELGIADSVEFAGALPREKVLSRLSTASLLVFPSLWPETFGLPILEAASQSVPAIVTDIGSQSSLVQDGVTGRRVPVGDPVALSMALRELLSDPSALRRMGAAARAAFEASDCLAERNVARLLAIYREVAPGV